MIANYSSRMYQVTTDYEHVNPVTTSWGIGSILDESQDLEERYAMLNILDQILDLRVGEGMYFQPNRDDKQSFGIIRRIS